MDLFRAFPLAALCALAACGSAQDHDRAQPGDAMMTEAIEGQLMVDPDLSQQNMRNMAVVPGGPVDPALPSPDGPVKK